MSQVRGKFMENPTGTISEHELKKYEGVQCRKVS